MSEQYCPLCKQTVSQKLYEKITGVWQEKEQKLAALRKKEKQLLDREKKLRRDFEAEKKKIATAEQAKFEKQLKRQKADLDKIIQKERRAIKKEQQAIKKDYEKKLSAQIDQIKKQERASQKKLEEQLKKRFQASTNLIIEKEKKRLEKEKNKMLKHDKKNMDKYNKLNKQFVAMQKKNNKALEQADKKIKALEEQIQKNQTPQVLGLLEEKIFLGKLEELFPGDRFEHTGKVGDITHAIVENENEIGLLVYELKKVSNFSAKHIAQALSAKQQRKADYGLLITNAKRSKEEYGFWIEKGIIIIHPAGSLALISILRNHLVGLSKLKLSKEKRDKMVEAVLDYIQSPAFKNAIEGIILDTKELYLDLKKEVNQHIKTWEFRLSKYQSMHGTASRIENKVVNLLTEENKPSRRLDEDKIAPILLPEKIK